MALHDVVLPAAVLVVAVAVLVLVWRVRIAQREDGGVETDQLAAAIGETWRELEFDRTVGRLEAHAEEMRQFHGDVAAMLRTPQERGAFGERQLEVILADHLPPEAYGIREQVVDGKAPDAHVESATGTICIDSKFPLDNYEAFVEATDEDERERYRRAFRRDVENQLAKIADDYVRPAAGTTAFAFAFVPSESVYYHLVSQEYDLLRGYTAEGVQVVSPLTLGHKLELIRADVRARELSEQAEEVLDRLDRLGERFEAVREEWETLFRHVRNAKNKADDVQRAYDRLEAEFERVERPGAEE